MSTDLELSTDRLADDLDYDAAHGITVQIRNQMSDIQESIDEVQGKITRAYAGRAWVAMGYESWEEYAIKEFTNRKLKLPSAERKELHVAMRKAKMSFRAIAAATGASKDTVQRDIESDNDSGVADETPTVVGTDGREQAAKKPKAKPKPKEEVPKIDREALWLAIQKAAEGKNPTAARASKLYALVEQLAQSYEPKDAAA